MALNHADRLAVRANIVPRCTGVVVKYALELLDDAAATVPKKEWAANAVREPQAVGNAVSWFVLGNQSYIDNGSSVTDGDLEFIVQSAVNAHFVAQA